MNIDDVLLTDGEQSQAIQQADGWIASLNTPYGRRFLEDIGDNLAKAQCLKLLEWLIKSGRISHVETWVWVECQDCKAGITHTHSNSHFGWYQHTPDGCWLCELESKLKESADA